MARTKRLEIRVSADELGRLAVAASALGMGLTTWVRHLALSAASTVPQLPVPFQPLPAPRMPARYRRRALTFLTEEQFVALDEQARACELTLSAFIREELLGRKPVPRHSPTRSAIVAVNRAGNNLNQVLLLAASGVPSMPDLLSAVAELRQEIHALRDALLTADAAADADSPT